MTGAHSRSHESYSSLPDSIFAQLAAFAVNLSVRNVPEEVRQQAKLCILDTIGCMVAGSDNEDATMLFESERSRSARADAAVLGKNAKLSMESAARVNGYMGDLLELNDLIGGHASIANVTAALAAQKACTRLVQR